MRHRTTLKNRIHAALIAFGHPCPVSDLFGHAGRELLDRLQIPDPWRANIDVSLRLIDDLELQISQLTVQLKRQGADHRYIPLLVTAPGLGWINAFTVASEIGDMTRPETELAHLFRALKAPAAARALPKLADRARAEQWSYEQFAAVLLKTETDSRDSRGGQARIKAARFPARKTLEEFDFAFQSSLRRDAVLHLGQLDFLAGRENVVLLGPPGTGKSHLAIALGIRACLAGHRVAFRTATEWVAMLADAQRHGRLDTELDKLQRIPLLIVDEVGYIPFDPQAANLMFMLVSRRYERASLIVTSNKPFSAWGEIFGDEITAAAMIDRLVHHAELLALKGDSYRLKDRDLARPPADN